MIDDIVTRLKAEGDFNSVGDGTKRWESNSVCIEAANEIQSLRIVVDDLVKRLAHYENDDNEGDSLLFDLEQQISYLTNALGFATHWLAHLNTGNCINCRTAEQVVSEALQIVKPVIIAAPQETYPHEH